MASFRGRQASSRIWLAVAMYLQGGSDWTTSEILCYDGQGLRWDVGSNGREPELARTAGMVAGKLTCLEPVRRCSR